MKESIIQSLIEDNIKISDKPDWDFIISIQRDNKEDRLSIEESKSKSFDHIDVDDVYSWVEVIDLRDQQKTMNDKARERLDEYAKSAWYDDAIDFWIKNASKWMDKLSIKEERSKWDHDANVKYLREFKEVLWLSSDKEKVKIITDIRKSGDALFSK